MQEEDLSPINQTIIDFSNAISSKNFESACQAFDSDGYVILAGSDKNELHKGKEAIGNFLRSFFSKPFTVHWDLTDINAGRNGDTGWLFADGTASIEFESGEAEAMPYRISAVVVRKNKGWKLKLFNGSVPQ